VQIGDQQSAVQRLGPRRNLIRAGLQRVVLGALKDRRANEARQNQQASEYDRDQEELPHRRQRITSGALRSDLLRLPALDEFGDYAYG
jgi:hypothetical protein